MRVSSDMYIFNITFYNLRNLRQKYNLAGYYNKMATTTSEIIGIFTGLLLFLFIVIFVYYYYFKIESALTRNGILVVLIWLITSSITIVIKSTIGKDFNVGSAFLLNLFSVGVIVVPLLFILYTFPIIGRAFENTIGYFFINNDDLTTVMRKIFKSQSGAPYDFNVLITQMFDDGTLDNYLDTMALKDIVKQEDEPSQESLATLREIVGKKHSMSEATFVSLATVVASLICFLPVVYQLF